MTTKRRALGRGLAALIPAAGPAVAAPSAALGAVAVPADTGAGATDFGHNGVDGTLVPRGDGDGESGTRTSADAAGQAGAAGAGLSPSGSRSGGVRAAVPGGVASSLHVGRPPGEPREGLRVVGIEEVHPTRGQPRKTFDDARLDELATSIRTQGLIQPLVVRVRPAASGSGGGYEIIAGERRWRAAQRAGLHTIPVVVRDIAPDRAFELAMVENLQREDLNPIEEAEGFERLIRDFGYSQESLAARVGKDRTTVSNALRLLKLPAGVRSLVIAGRLSMGHARAILGLESLVEAASSSSSAAAGPREATPSGRPPLSAEYVAEQMERLGRRVAARDMSVRQVEAIVRAERAAATASDAPVESGDSTPAPTVSGRDLATRLSRNLGTRVRVVEAGPGRGHVEIHYQSLDQLDGLLAKLMP